MSFSTSLSSFPPYHLLGIASEIFLSELPVAHPFISLRGLISWIQEINNSFPDLFRSLCTVAYAFLAPFFYTLPCVYTFYKELQSPSGWGNLGSVTWLSWASRMNYKWQCATSKSRSQSRSLGCFCLCSYTFPRPSEPAQTGLLEVEEHMD